MSTIHITGDGQPTRDEAERTTKNYNPSIQELAEEQPDEAPDKTPISDDERKSLDERTDDEFRSPLDQGSEIRDRAPLFEVPGQWVPPYVKARRQREMMLPNAKAVHDLEKRVAELAVVDGAPELIRDAIKAAREALDNVRTVYREGGHPDNPRFARDQEAKDRAIVALADATKAVAALETVARRGDLRDEWFATLAGGIEEKRAKALEALREAERAYATLRGSIASAKSLGIQQGRFDNSWHSSPVGELPLTRALPVIREAIDLVDPASDESDDYTTGRFLVAEYEEGTLPPHTMAHLRHAGERAGGGTFPWQLHARAVARSKDDAALQEAIATKNLRVFLNSNPYQPRRDDIAGGIGG